MEVSEAFAGPAGSLKIAIVGAGAIGSYYGGILAHAGEDVHFLLRSDYEHVRQHGMQIIRHGRDTFTLRPPVYKQASDIGTVDLVIVAAKATANPQLIDLIRPLLGGSTLLLTLQNGMGNADYFAEHLLPRERIIGGLCFVCINRTAPGVIENYMPGSITLAESSGPVQERTKDIAGRLLRAGTPMRLADDFDEVLWRKLIWNVPFNGLTIAAGGIDCGRLLAAAGMEAEVRALMQEVQTAACAYGYAIPDTFLDKQIEVTYPMTDYKPSSLLDYLDNKPVEVEAIWGEPLRRARAKGVATPKLELLYHLLSAMCR